jgi:citronellol/citronellal dehydrogenase
MRTEFRSPLAEDANAGRIAIVTGGGTGIGRATARELARTGAGVAICGRRPEPLEDARAELEAAGRDVLAMPCDVREPEQVGAFLDAVQDRLGPVDVLVNNAGGQFAAPLEAIELKGLRAVHRLNVDAPWDLTHRVAERWMIPRRRGFVCLIGFSPRRGIPLMAHSSAARAALENMA